MGDLQLSLPIHATILSCEQIEAQFRPAILPIEYIIGSGLLQTKLPKIEQTPDCGKVISLFKLDEIESSLASEEVLGAIHID